MCGNYLEDFMHAVMQGATSSASIPCQSPTFFRTPDAPCACRSALRRPCDSIAQEFCHVTAILARHVLVRLHSATEVRTLSRHCAEVVLGVAGPHLCKTISREAISWAAFTKTRKVSDCTFSPAVQPFSMYVGADPMPRIRKAALQPKHRTGPKI